MDEPTRWDKGRRGAGIYLGLIAPPEGARRSRSARAWRIGPDTKRSDLIVAIAESTVLVLLMTGEVLFGQSFWRLLAAFALVPIAAGLRRYLRNVRGFAH